MNKTMVLLIALLICLLGAASFSFYKIYSEIKEVSEAETASQELQEFSPKNSFDEGLSPKEIYAEFADGLRELQAVNKDVAGWIYIPKTNIDYPLLQGSDNEYYLTHSVKGGYSAAGSIFIDKKGFSEGNTIIYGHNMGRSSDIMFHDVVNFGDKIFFDSVKTGYIIVEGGIFSLDIFAFSMTLPLSGFYEDDLTVDFIRENAVNFREPAEGKLFTLSTCAYDYKDARAVLNCSANVVWTE